MNWNWTHKGYHGRAEMSLRAPSGSQAGDTVEVSCRVATRLNNLVCGMCNCQCGERVAMTGAEMHGTSYGWDRWYVSLPKLG